MLTEAERIGVNLMQHIVIMTVPAHQCLWSKYDVIARHKRRYNTPSLKKLVHQNGFNILEMKHFFISILPLLFLRKILNKDNHKNLCDNKVKEEFKINPILNFICKLMLNIENQILKKVSPKIGGSIAIVAEKKCDKI